MRHCLFAGTLLLLSGCLGNSYLAWQHPAGLSNAELQTAKAQCRQLAQNEVNRFDYYEPYYDHPFYYERYSRGGHYRPYFWRRSYYDFHRYNIDLDRFYKVCMQAKGWYLVRIDPEAPPAR